MLSRNLKYHRLRNAMTMKELAEQINVSPMAISNYESGKRRPSMDLLKQMASVFDVRVSDFLALRNEKLVFTHGDFRKNTTLTVGQQDFIHESVEEYFGRFMTVVDLLGGKALPDAPSTHVLPLTDNSEHDAISLRKHLNLSAEGPIDSLVGILENKGILFFACDLDNDKFSGLSGFVNNRPYVVVNKNMNTERNRSTIVHELAHLMFKWPEDMEERNIEKKATAISGAFLLPKSDAIRELGVRRTLIAKDMELVAVEYGISMFMLVKRARLAGIITQSLEKDSYIMFSKMGWRKDEPSRIENEKPVLFEQLVCRAVNEKEISIQRGAELLKVSYEKILENCTFSETKN